MVRSFADVKSSQATDILKIIAVITMIIDHIGAVFYPQYRILRYIGRVAFPLYAYCIAVGCAATRDIRKYALRMFASAMLIQPLYVTSMNHLKMLSFDWAHNFYRLDLIFRHYYLTDHHVIHFTLLLGILVIWTIRDRKYPLTALMLAVCWYTQSYYDYGMYGIYLMVMFYAFLDRPLASVVWVGLYMAWYGLNGTITTRLYPLPTRISVLSQFYALTALPLIYLPMKSRFRLNKWIYYALYPAHLVVFYLVRLYS